MIDNSTAILILCSHLTDDVKPYEPREWNKLSNILKTNNIEPVDILSFNDDDLKSKLNYNQNEIERIKRLIDRSESILDEKNKYSNIGINIVTLADKNYPQKIKNKLINNPPPVLYYSGNLENLKYKYIGFVGSRSVDTEDIKITESLVNTVNKSGYGVVSGGAKGVDRVACDKSISNGNLVVEYLSDSLYKRAINKTDINLILNNKLLLISPAKPDGAFNTGMAMMRNKYIYIQSEATVVIKSDYKKGGTWSGASDCIKNSYSNVFCYNNENYKGNMELINMGATPIDENWNCCLENIEGVKKDIQLSLFDC